jgi:acetylornithine deacetylase
MDSIAREAVDLTRALVDIDSTTGREGECGRWLADHLRSLGYTVLEQPVEGDRFNILATLDRPRVTFSTHFDCVPPFFPSRVDGDRLFGRGACDAKGILAAQIVAAQRLKQAGIRDVGMLFVVGEERGSDGALAANTLAAQTLQTFDGGPSYLINGEPTDNRLGIATRGVWRVKLRASGRAAHSSHPEQGESAIEKLLDTLMHLRRIRLPSDDLLGTTNYSVGLIAGGVAPNVVPPWAEAEIVFRSVGPGSGIRAVLKPLETSVAIEDVLEVPPVKMHVVPGFDAAVFAYTTDVPLLPAWGAPLLYGPGSILHAHTAEEHVLVSDLERASQDYEKLARTLLARA